MSNIVIENSMLVDTWLKTYLAQSSISVDKTFVGLKWKTEEEIAAMIDFILSGEKKHIFLATSYMDPEYIKELFEVIHRNVASVSVFIYDSNAETIVISYSRKYPEVKFELLNRFLRS